MTKKALRFIPSAEELWDQHITRANEFPSPRDNDVTRLGLDYALESYTLAMRHLRSDGVPMEIRLSWFAEEDYSSLLCMLGAVQEYLGLGLNNTIPKHVNSDFRGIPFTPRNSPIGASTQMYWQLDCDVADSEYGYIDIFTDTTEGAPPRRLANMHINNGVLVDGFVTTAQVPITMIQGRLGYLPADLFQPDSLLTSLTELRQDTTGKFTCTYIKSLNQMAHIAISDRGVVISDGRIV